MRHSLSFQNRLPHALLIAGVSLGLLMVSGCKPEAIIDQMTAAKANESAQKLMQSGNTTGAITVLETAHTTNPTEPNTQYNLAVAYQAHGDEDKAISLLTQLLDQPQGLDVSEIAKTLGIAYEAKGDKLETAAKGASEQSSPQETPSHESANGSEAYNAKQTYEMAVQYYKRALSGAKNPEAIQVQIAALENKLAHPSKGAVAK